MQSAGYNPPANRITFRTVYNDVEAIKAYLRRFKPRNGAYIDEDIIRDMISDYLSDLTDDILSERFSSFFNDMISPLRPEWVSDDNGFIERIVSGVKQCECTTDSIVSIVSSKLMSIIEFNSESFIEYIEENIECDITSDQIISIITDNKDTILNYISGDIYDYISDDILALISPLKTAYVNNDFIEYIEENITFDNASVEQVLADQYPELDVKYMLRDYHLIDKHYIELTSNVLTIPTHDLYNPASAFERFRLLAHISSDAANSEPLTDLNMVLNNNVYQFVEPASQSLVAELRTDTSGLTLMLTGVFNSYIGNNSVLWYGFTDLVNPISTNPPLYTVMVSIDCSPNYLKLMNYEGNNPTGYMTVSYNNRKSYNGAYATNVRKQFGNNIEVVEVVPHPLLINDQERYIVIRAITDSDKKGYWQYLKNSSNIDTYHYNKKYNKSVLTFSPLESPIMYANIQSGDTNGNYYIYKLDQTFADNNVYNDNVYTIDLSNFVPFTSALPDGLTTESSANPMFNNINIGGSNFGLLQLRDAFNSCENLASIDLRYIVDYLNTNQDTFSNTFISCVNLNTIFCNQQIGELISNVYTFKDSNGGTRSCSYDTGLKALIIGTAPTQSTDNT